MIDVTSKSIVDGARVCSDSRQSSSRPCSLFFRVPRLFSDMSQAVDSLNKSVSALRMAVDALKVSCDSLERRAEVTDRILSDLIGEPLDSQVVAKDGTKYPRIHHHRKSKSKEPA